MPETKIDAQVGKEIKKWRTGKGMTLRELADKVGLPLTNIFQTERGMYQIRYDWVHRIAEALETDLPTLVAPIYRKKKTQQ